MKRGLSVCGALLLMVLLLGLFAGPSMVRSGLRLVYPRPYSRLVAREAAEFQLEENLVYGVMYAESRFDEDALSHAGACGLMQLTPDTFEWIASLYPPETADSGPEDPAANIHCGCALLRLLLNHYESLQVALCAYNAGMGTVDRWLKDEDYSSDGKTLHTIPYPETESYVEKVCRTMERYQKLY